MIMLNMMSRTPHQPPLQYHHGQQVSRKVIHCLDVVTFNVRLSLNIMDMAAQFIIKRKRLPLLGLRRILQHSW